MKTLFFALFVLFAINAKLPSATADFVRDTDGDLLRNGGTYYILPVFRGRGGGLGLARTGNETCPLTVAQDPNESSYGLPVRIASPYRILDVYEGLILDLSFVALPTCASTPSKWEVTKEEAKGGSVKITGSEGTINGWFQIHPYLGDYKLVFCARSRASCTDLGIYIDNDGNRPLVLNNRNPFAVMFKKVDTSDI